MWAIQAAQLEFAVKTQVYRDGLNIASTNYHGGPLKGETTVFDWVHFLYPVKHLNPKGFADSPH